jgi:hypothetical protein
MKVSLYPGDHRLAVEDTITLPDGHGREAVILLHEGLVPAPVTSGIIIRRNERQEEGGIAAFYRVELPEGTKAFTIRYEGALFHRLDEGGEQARGFSSTPGMISREGVFLSGASFWYPVVEGRMVAFRLQIKLPGGWDAVSQGRRGEHLKEKDRTVVSWESPEPQEEVYVVASAFTEYSKTFSSPLGRSISAMAFLRTPDRALADKYLDATEQYVSMYERLIGAYPYAKFALAENFWETGFGMPSFTLLGPTVIRLPFIINSSYPHEILHNWWGNSVYPDYGQGNWSEGLTAYLSDHLIKEQQGTGAEYREATLQKYADYVLRGRDFPLTDFHARHSPASEAVGYGKSLMLFHMLRMDLGDQVFSNGLRHFYEEKRFSVASFSDLRASFESASGKDLSREFSQLVTRPGAPKLRLADVIVRKAEEGYIVTGTLEQTQEQEPYVISVPFAITMEGEEQAYQGLISMDGKRTVFAVPATRRPARIDIDPEFDLFRALDREEIPPAISQVLGSEKVLVIVPSSAKAEMITTGYRDFALGMKRTVQGSVEVKNDAEVNSLPVDRAVVVLGWENRHAKTALAAMSGYHVAADREKIRIGMTEMQIAGNAVVLTARHPQNKDAAVMFIASSGPAALPGLGRKMPHYHKYSYLVFSGDEPENIAKGRWPVTGSPLTVFFAGDDGVLRQSRMGRLRKREPLVMQSPPHSSGRMLETIRTLASEELEGRGFGTEGLERAAAFIAEKFRESGLRPGGDHDGSYFRAWEENGMGPERMTTLKNIVGIIPGRKPEYAGQCIVVGAHYDHLGRGWPDVRAGNEGKIHPGADDNASGVAVLLELAGVLAGRLQPDRDVVFVAFAGEEAGRLGSLRYVAGRRPVASEGIMAMINLDTVGRLENRKLLVLGTGSAKEWPHIFRGAGFVTGVETEMVSERLDASDNISFEDAGIPAVQLFSGPHGDYHRPTDTPEKIDPAGLVKVGMVAKEVVEYLAFREEPLMYSAKRADGSSRETNKERKVTLGTVPDFAYSGKGCRITGVMPGSPAEACGLIEGDVITAVNEKPVNSLKDLSDILKTLAPGERVTVTFIRNGKGMSAEATVVAK